MRTCPRCQDNRIDDSVIVTDLVEAKLSHNQVYGLSASDCQDPVNLPVYSHHEESKQNRETNLASLVANCEHVDQIRLKETFVDSNLLVAKVGQVSHFIQLLSLLSQVGRKRYLETKFEKIQIDGRVEAHISLTSNLFTLSKPTKRGWRRKRTDSVHVRLDQNAFGQSEQILGHNLHQDTSGERELHEGGSD